MTTKEDRDNHPRPGITPPLIPAAKSQAILRPGLSRRGSCPVPAGPRGGTRRLPSPESVFGGAGTPPPIPPAGTTTGSRHWRQKRGGSGCFSLGSGSSVGRLAAAGSDARPPRAARRAESAKSPRRARQRRPFSVLPSNGGPSGAWDAPAIPRISEGRDEGTRMTRSGTARGNEEACHPRRCHPRRAPKARGKGTQ